MAYLPLLPSTPSCDGGRGASETAFIFVAEEAGVYPFRLTWENGGGDANVEFDATVGAILNPFVSLLVIRDLARQG